VEAAPVTHVITSPTASTAELHARRASEAFSGARYMQAIRQAEEAIGQGHATYEVYLTLGRAYRQVGRARAAAEAFERAAKLRPTGEALLLAGQAWRVAGDTMQAQIAYTRARALDRSNADIPYELGLILLDEGHLAQAEGELREALALAPQRPQTPRILVALGRVAVARQQPAEATDYLTRALALDPTNSEARQALAQAGKAGSAGQPGPVGQTPQAGQRARP